MTTAQTDPVRVAIPDAPRDDVEGHTYAWYDPDAATFDLPDDVLELDMLTDEDVTANVDWG